MVTWWLVVGGIVLCLAVYFRKVIKYRLTMGGVGVNNSLRNVQVAQVKKIIKAYDIKKSELY